MLRDYASVADGLAVDYVLRDAGSESGYRVLIAAVGAGHPLNINGIGGGAAVTTKVVMLSPSTLPDADIDYFFAQVAVEEPLEIRVVVEQAGRRRRHPIAVTMRTPGHDFELAAGFLHGEGALGERRQVAGIAYCRAAAAEEAARTIVRDVLKSEQTEPAPPSEEGDKQSARTPANPVLVAFGLMLEQLVPEAQAAQADIDIEGGSVHVPNTAIHLVGGIKYDF